MTETETTVDFDHYDDAYAQDPYPAFAELRAGCPVAHSSSHGGFWIVSRYDLVQELAHDTARFSSRYTSVPSDIGLGDVVIPPLQLDPPAHSRVKRLLAGAFVPKRVKPFEPLVRAYTAELLDGLAARASFDASQDFARLVPTALVCQLLGVPHEVDRLTGWVARMLEQATTDPDDAAAAGMELFSFVTGLVEARRAEPGPDILSQLLEAELDGDRLGDDEVTFVGILLVLAGIDTTWSTLGTTIEYLATHPEAQSRLRAEPALLDTAVEEFLRVFAPVTVARQVTTDATWHDADLRQGDMVLVSFPAANRDEEAFPQAEELVLDRSPNRHMAFGTGVHRCLGVNFARMELRVALDEMLRRLPPFRLVPGAEVVWSKGQVRGPKHLFLQLDPFDGGAKVTDGDVTVLDTKTLTVRVTGPVAELMLTRPEIHNRFDAELHDDFVAAVAALREQPDIRAAVIASTGDVFSAGGDFDFMLKAHDDLPFLLSHVDIGRALLMSLCELPIPVVAALQGPAIGLGATVVLACDAVVACPAASLADPHVRVGLTAGDGGCLLWPQALGLTGARRYLLTGDRLDAERAYQLGVVSDLVDGPEQVLPAARVLAERMAALPPLAVQNTKRALAAVLRHRADEVVDLAFAYETQTVLSEDLVEAIAAFRERRPATYGGR